MVAFDNSYESIIRVKCNEEYEQLDIIIKRDSIN